MQGGRLIAIVLLIVLAFGAAMGSIWTVAVCGLLLLCLLLYHGIHSVSEGQAVVVERLNRFARVSGPGLVWVWPGIERIARPVHVRLRAERFDVDNVPTREQVPVECTVTVAYRISFGEAERLKHEVAYYNSGQWHEIVRSQLESTLAAVVRSRSVFTIIGADRRGWDEIRDQMATELHGSLPEWAVVLDERHGVTLSNIQLPRQLGDALEKALTAGIDNKTRMGVLDNILQHYPGIPHMVLLELMQSLRDHPNQQTVVVPAELGYAMQPPAPDALPGSSEDSPTPLVDHAKRRSTAIVRGITRRTGGSD